MFDESGFFRLEQVSQRTIPNALDNFNHNGKKIQQRIPRFRRIILIFGQKQIAPIINSCYCKKPDNMNLNREYIGGLKSFEGLEIMIGIDEGVFEIYLVV